MNWRDVVQLIPVTMVKNSFGGENEQEGTPREVMANQKSVKQTEFYAAFAIGLNPHIVFEIKKFEYNQEPKLTHEGTAYHVIRTYSKNGETLELTCSVHSAHSGSRG